jgi:Phage capsid family
MPRVNSFETDHPTHIPRMTEPTVDSTIWAAPNAAVAEFEGGTSELVLMGRSLKALKIMARISNESMRSSEALVASQQTLVNLIRKQVDNALLQGNAGANITGLIPSAGTTVKHSRFVGDALLNSSTTVTSATPAFTSGDVRSFVTGTGIPAGATIAPVTNATTVVLSAAATATGSGVTITITTNYAIYDRLVDALTASQVAYADPKYWIINARTIGVLRKLEDTQGHPLLSPDTTVEGAEIPLVAR